jgi:hypothetical protein
MFILFSANDNQKTIGPKLIRTKDRSSGIYAATETAAGIAGSLANNGDRARFGVGITGLDKKEPPRQYAAKYRGILMNNSRLLKTVYVLALTLLATTVQGALVVPTGLSTGDPYHVIFVSSTTRDATSSNIADYDAHVQSAADAAGIGASLSVSWLALGSTPTVDVFDHLMPLFSNTNTVPIYNQNGDLVASSLADMFDRFTTLSAPIQYDELANSLTTDVWTGSTRDGVVSVWSLGGQGGAGTQFAMFGNSDVQFSQTWVANGAGNVINSFSFYAVSQELTADVVPVPAAIWLFGSALGLLGWLRHKKA